MMALQQSVVVVLLSIVLALAIPKMWFVFVGIGLALSIALTCWGIYRTSDVDAASFGKRDSPKLALPPQGDNRTAARRSSSRARFWAIAAGFTTFTCAAALPMWLNWRGFGPQGGEQTTTLYSNIGTLPKQVEEVGLGLTLVELQRANIGLGAIVFGISFLIGWLVHHCLRWPTMEWITSLTTAICILSLFGLFASHFAKDGFGYAVTVVCLYVGLLILEFMCVEWFTSDEIAESSGDVLDTILPLKQQGTLLFRGLHRPRKKHRASVQPYESLVQADGELDRLVAVKQSLRLTELEKIEPRSISDAKQ
jgi:hypothetical protein